MDTKQHLCIILNYEMHNCTKCRLCQSRNNVVTGEGNLDAKLMFVGEGPGVEEDHTGKPFVGRSGQLLNKMMEAIGLKREEVFIANVVKCRPPNNRTPSKDEITACLDYLRKQVYIIKPRIIVCLGSPAAKSIINEELSITRDRGIWTERKGYWLIATFHPAALLRDESKKKEAWDDMRTIQAKYIEVTAKGENGEREEIS